MNQKGEVIMHGEKKWTDEIDNVVRNAWAVGTSAIDCASIIYARFGVIFTRNAIIGKVHRKGYRTSAPPHRHGPPGIVKTRMPKKKEPRVSLRVQYGEPRMKPDTRLRSRPDAPTKSRDLTLLELPPRCCLYATSPDDAATHLFCGAPQEEGSVYCSHHTRIAYRSTPRLMENNGPVLVARYAGWGAGL